MSDYKNMYLTLFNEITDVIAQLIKVQQKAEEMYLRDENKPIELFKNPKDNESDDTNDL